MLWNLWNSLISKSHDWLLYCHIFKFYSSIIDVVLSFLLHEKHPAKSCVLQQFQKKHLKPKIGESRMIYHLWKNKYAVKGITKCFILIQERQYSFVQVLNLVWKKSINLHIKLYFHIPLTEFSIISSLSCPETYFTKLNLSAPSAKSTFTFLIVFMLEKILHQHIQFARSTHK